MDELAGVVQEDDEELILESSPLDQYLKEIGMHDVQTFTGDRTVLFESDKSYNSRYQSTKKVLDERRYRNKPLANFTFIWSLILEALLFPIYYLKLIRLRSLQRTSQNVVNTILSSEVFSAFEDCIVFKKYLKEVYGDFLQSNKSSVIFINCSFFGTFTVSTLVAIVGVLFWQIKTSMLCYRGRCDWLFVLAIMLALYIFGLILPQIILALTDHFSTLKVGFIIKNVVTLLHEYNKFLDQSIRHLREVEITSMGYIYPSAHALACQNSNQKVYFDPLRKLLAETAYLGVGEFIMLIHGFSSAFVQSSNTKLINLHCILASTDVMEQFAEELGTPPKDHSLLTLTLLKDYVTLFRFVNGEFLKTIVVSIACSQPEDINEGTGFDKSVVDKNISALRGGLIELPRLFNTFLLSMERRIHVCTQHLRFSQKYPFGPVSEEAPQKINTNTKESQLFNFIHAAELHYKAVLHSLGEMRLMINNLDTVKSLFDPLPLQSSLSTCQVRAMAGNVCIEDINSEVASLTSLEENICCSKESEANGQSENTDVDDGDKNHAHNSVDSRIETSGDKIFEGESDPCDKSIRDKSCLPDVSLEDAREQLRNSKRLLSELTTILSCKDSPIGLISFDQIKKAKEASVEETFIVNSPHEVSTQTADTNESVRQKKPYNSGIQSDEKFEYTHINDECNEYLLASGDFKPLVNPSNALLMQQDNISMPDGNARLTEDNLSVVQTDDICTVQAPALSFQMSFAKSILERSEILGLKEETFGEDSDGQESFQ